MAEAYIVDAVRTPVGKKNGGLSAVHPADLGAHILGALVERSRASTRPPSKTSICGCLDAVRSAGRRHRAHRVAGGGLPGEVPGTTVDRQCGSSQQAMHFAAQGVHERHPGRRGGRRRAEHEQRSRSGRAFTAPAARSRGHDPFTGSARAGSKRYGDQPSLPVPRRGADRREVGHQPRGHGGVRARDPPAGDPGDRRRLLRRARSRRSAVSRSTRARAADTTLEKMASLKPLRRRPDHRRGLLADLRRRGRAARSPPSGR